MSKKFGGLELLIFLAVSIISPWSASAAPVETERTFPVAAVISQIKKELAAAQKTVGANAGLRLEKVELSFALQNTQDVNGKLSVGIPVAGLELGGSGSKKVENGSSLQLELAPPKSSVTMSGSSVDDKDFGITQAIVETRRQLQQGLDQEPKMEPRKVQITLKFGVIRTVGGSGQIKFLVVSAGGGAGSVSTDTNTISLTFAKGAAP